VQQRPVPEVEESLSWRTGFIVLRDVTLSEAVAEFNRYSQQKLIIEDPAVAGIRITGKLRATNVDAFVRLLEDGFGIHSHVVDHDVLLTGY
jgi:transmembrane sensor